MGHAYKIVSIGLSEKDLPGLKRILKLSSDSRRSYSISESLDEPADIVLVNADIKYSNEKAKAAIKKAQAEKTVVYATAKPESINYQQVIKSPFYGTKVVRLFDRMIMDKTGELPDVEISDSIHTYKVDRMLKDLGESDAAQTSQKNLRALVLDDSSAVRKQMELVLSSNNFMPILAETGEQALELIEDQMFDIAFLDVVLPGIDGYEVCKRIKKNKAKQSMPVVMLTSRSSPFDRVRGSLAGCDMYLTKPVAQKNFKATLDKYFNVMKGARLAH